MLSLSTGLLIVLLFCLLLACAFEFVNGFHDTANAVATVIYTHSLPAQFAVIWSGSFNFLGVLLSSGAVAFGIISLLPVELILQVGSGAGFAQTTQIPGFRNCRNAQVVAIASARRARIRRAVICVAAADSV